MGKVVTINQKLEFPSDITETIVTRTKVKIDGIEDVAETRFLTLDQNEGGYDKYKILFMKKCNIGGFLNGQEFNSFLRKYETYAYANSEADYIFTVGNIKGCIPRAAFKRLKNTSEVKCSGVEIDLVEAILLLLEANGNITVNSGWFSNLGTNLRNAWLQGQNVNTNADWIRFKNTEGSELKNIELKIEDDDFEKGYILLSLSSRGFLHTNNSISDIKFLQITEEIIGIIQPAILLSYNDDGDDE